MACAQRGAEAASAGDLAKHVHRRGGLPREAVSIEVKEPELRLEAEVPFEVVDQRPVVIATHVGALAARAGDLLERAHHDLRSPRPALGRDAVLGHHDGQRREALRERAQLHEQGLRAPRIAHGRDLEARIEGRNAGTGAEVAAVIRAEGETEIGEDRGLPRDPRAKVGLHAHPVERALPFRVRLLEHGVEVCVEAALEEEADRGLPHDVVQAIPRRDVLGQIARFVVPRRNPLLQREPEPDGGGGAVSIGVDGVALSQRMREPRV